MPKSDSLERHTIFVIVCVATLSTLAMITYPIVAASLQLTDLQAGLFFGGSIHDVAQVLGAGYAVSDEAGEVATVTKLLRVAMLFPIVALIALWVGRQGLGAVSAVPKLPGFLLAFMAIVIANSVGLIAPFIAVYLTEAARFFLVISVAALGVKTRFEGLREVGWQPILIVCVQTVLMAACMIGFVMMTVAG